MNIALFNKNHRAIIPQISMDMDIIGDEEELLARLRQKTFNAILLISTKEYPIGSSFVKKVNAKAPIAAIFVLHENSFFDFERTQLLIDANFIYPLSEDSLEEFENLLITKEILCRSNIIGRSESIYNTGKIINRVSKLDLSVLVTGESGAGKELVAHAIHFNSFRAGKEFIAVNSGAIPENLIEAELFGYVKGAFTGANAHKEGIFMRANGGTIFLDEIAELPLQSQVKLLRILENGEFFPVGSNRPVKTDVRIVAATNKDLKTMIAQGTFREDLYYRLGVVNIFLPPLRERPKDILILTNYFQKLLEEKYTRAFPGFTPDAVDGLLGYNYPGNVRELKNLIDNALLLSGNNKISYNDLRNYFDNHTNFNRNLPQIHKPEFSQNTEFLQILGYLANELREIRHDLDEIKSEIRKPSTHQIYSEEDRIRDALRQANGNKSAAADILGISRRTLYRKIDKLGLDEELF